MDLNCGPCKIRHWHPKDRASLLRLADNHRIWRNLSHRFPHPYTDADADFWFTMLAQTALPTHWAIDLDGLAIGGIGIDIGAGVFARSAHFGYWLGEPYWGRGLMTAAVRAMVDFIFKEFNLVRLESPVFEWNPASMCVLEKCGFQREGVLRRSVDKDGEIIDTVLYARLRDANPG